MRQYVYDLSILIVSWNTSDLLADCLHSIYAHTPNLSFEVIVVDNASSDGTADMIRSVFPHVVLVENEQNVGFGMASNQGFQLAVGKYVGILNPDTVLLNRAFVILVSHLESMLQVGIIGPKIEGANGTTQQTCARGYITLWSDFLQASGLRSKLKGQNNSASNAHLAMRQVDCISGACFVVRRNAVQSAQLFDPRFFMYGEDVDLCYRVKSNGWKIFYCPEARVLHYGGASSALNPETPLFGARSNNLYIAIHYGSVAGWLDKVMWFSVSAGKFIVSLSALLILPQSRHRKWVYRRNLYMQLMKWALNPAVVARR